MSMPVVTPEKLDMQALADEWEVAQKQLLEARNALQAAEQRFKASDARASNAETKIRLLLGMFKEPVRLKTAKFDFWIGSENRLYHSKKD
jgi:hypothetical protein